MNFETVIGLEVHVQLLTKSKMFCSCSTEYSDAPPNTFVCPVCLALPGTLPVINQQAVEYTIMTALALHCHIPGYTKFDRKNYPYPDLMKGYQISQYDAPLGQRGWLDIEANDQRKRIGITRVHLEEDVAKLLHRTSVNGESYSLVDVNRSGVPLMEIVGEPDLRSPEEARQYLMKLRSIVRYLRVSMANMEEGSFRCDANISIRPENSTECLPRAEVKNMNSFRAVYRALEYEARRQRKVATEGKRLVQETRGWVEKTGKTVSMRSKEYAHDYRYLPEPDLPPLIISQERVNDIESRLPELPGTKRDRFIAEYRLSTYDASLLTSSREMADYFEACLKTEEIKQLPQGKRAKEIGNWLLGEASRIMNAKNVDISEFSRHVGPSQLGELIVCSHNTINTATAKAVLEEMFDTGKRANDIINQRGLSQISDAGAIDAEVTRVIASNHQAVADYKAGKAQSIKFLVGQVMKATRGRANPQVVTELLKQKLEGE
ncbi:MAG: Asp-tRNA(Asn)/Glu-tRNA(Gln) amidotransferase subunit GatB [Dehalococcoidales bacterium]|nr:Asp-tRNA(Asn)/Glu-tRNA(Gln) amidotransferase subunit GatB [Dehalococcoidales bacterium]